MSYKKIKFKELKEKFGIHQTRAAIFPTAIYEVTPSQRLQEDLAEAKSMALTSEKALSEGYVFPILKELRRRNLDSIELFSGEILVGDATVGLEGECDFLITLTPGAVELTDPIICITEAKKGVVDDSRSLAQTASQMLGARFFNLKHDKNLPTIYGACTNGTEWLFLRLRDQILEIDNERFHLAQLPKLLGALQMVVDEEKASVLSRTEIQQHTQK